MGSGEIVVPFPMFSKVFPEFTFPGFKLVFVDDEFVTCVWFLSLVQCGGPGNGNMVGAKVKVSAYGKVFGEVGGGSVHPG